MGMGMVVGFAVMVEGCSGDVFVGTPVLADFLVGVPSVVERLAVDG